MELDARIIIRRMTEEVRGYVSHWLAQFLSVWDRWPSGQFEKDDFTERLLSRCSVTFHKINLPLLYSPFLFLSFPSRTIINKDKPEEAGQNERTKEESIDIFIDEASGIDALDSTARPVILSLTVRPSVERSCFESFLLFY